MWISIGMAIWAQPNGPARLAHKMDQAGPIFLSPDPFGLGPFRPAKKGQKRVGPKWADLPVWHVFVFFIFFQIK